MRIRHAVALENVSAEGAILDPRRIRHCVVVGGRLAELSGEVDPHTHLNLDFPEHRADACIVAERLEPGAAVLITLKGGPRKAALHPAHLRHLGRPDVDQRRIDWLSVHRARRASLRDRHD